MLSFDSSIEGFFYFYTHQTPKHKKSTEIWRVLLAFCIGNPKWINLSDIVWKCDHKKKRRVILFACIVTRFTISICLVRIWWMILVKSTRQQMKIDEFARTPIQWNEIARKKNEFPSIVLNHLAETVLKLTASELRGQNCKVPHSRNDNSTKSETRWMILMLVVVVYRRTRVKNEIKCKAAFQRIHFIFSYALSQRMRWFSWTFFSTRKYLLYDSNISSQKKIATPIEANAIWRVAKYSMHLVFYFHISNIKLFAAS